MRHIKWLSLLTVLLLLCGTLTVGLSEGEAFVQLEEDIDLAFSPDEEAEALVEDLFLTDPAAPDDAPEDVVPNAGGSEVPLKNYNFPDPAFLNYLLTHCDTDGNGYLSDNEIYAVTSLDLHGLNITDLKGIEFLPSLGGLRCNDNLLSSLDLRGNPRLRVVDCSNNRLESLDLSECALLTVLDCSGNKLSSVRFPTARNLAQLTCSDNALLTLDLGIFNPDALITVAADVDRTITPGRPGSGGVTTIGTKDFSLTCDDYIQLTLNGKVLRSLTAKHIDFEATGATIEVHKTSLILPLFEPAEAVVPLYYTLGGDAGTISLTTKGKITGLKPGNARIFVYTDKNFAQSSFLLEFRVTVKPAKPTSVEFKYKNIELGIGETLPLETKVKPDDAVTALTFQSNDPKIASLFKSDNKMYVKGKKKGTTTITVETSNNKTGSCTVTVKAAPKKIKLSEKGTLKLGVGNSKFLQVSVEPKNSATSLTWTSSNTKVATVKHGTVTAKKKGTAVITVETFNGLKASVKFKVIDPVPESIELNRKNLKMNVGDSFQLIPTIEPDNAKNKKVTWSSSNKKVARVSKNGLVVARKKGTATITAKTSNGKKAKCKIKVVIPTATGIQIVHGKTTVKVKKKLTLKTVVTPAHAQPKLTWSSSDKSIATVDKKGKVKGKKKGTVTITVKTDNGLRDSIEITVN